MALCNINTIKRSNALLNYSDKIAYSEGTVNPNFMD